MVGIASVIAAIQPSLDLTTKAPTAQIVAPRRMNDQVESKKMILLEGNLDQRFFYFIDKRSVDIAQPFLVGFPFSIRNSGDKRLDHVSITFTFKPTMDKLLGDRPSLSDDAWPFLPDLPMSEVDLSGRNEPQRKYALTPKAASVTYSSLELLPNTEDFFEFHFAPRLYQASVLKDGAQVPIAAYDVAAKVVADGFDQSQRFRMVILPGRDDADFLVGVAAFSRLFACKYICEENWLGREIHKMPWLAEHFTQHFENVVVKPTTRIALAPNGPFKVLQPEGDVEVTRFIQTIGSRPGQ